MPPFKDEQIIIIAPGSETTVAQLGLPESFTPAKTRVRSRMFPAEKEGEWEPYKVRRKQSAEKPTGDQNGAADGEESKNVSSEQEEIIYEEDRISEEGAVWPIREGRIVNWSCFFALITHVYNTMNPPFHTPILLITQPAWTPREHEKLTQFFFEKFKTPAFSLMDSALATSWAFGVHTATVVDVGKDKVDITAISEFVPHVQGRVISLPGCGGEALTQGLLSLLKAKGFNRDMLPNSKKQKATFIYEDHALLDNLKNMNLGEKGLAEAHAALDEGPSKKAQDGTEEEVREGGEGSGAPGAKSGGIRREIEVGVERFQAASNGTLEKIADAVHRCVSSVDEVNKRSELWDSLIVCGNGSRLRGFKDALQATLQAKYVISPSSATIFTSEIPSNISTPAGTGANTPQPQSAPHGGSSQVNPLLLAATTAQNPHLMHPGANPILQGMNSHNQHSSHGQTPTSIKLVKPPEYFPEWKEPGYDEAAFLGAQVAAKVIFVVDQGQNKGYMTRPDYNDQGPTAIHDYSL
ncbi:actin-like ATPase domain-containing protein [Aaosphaeria arxii CBS 175.79]|uniref:Actin-like ATPase domain-containing protein n=1 Tax=Aaosphaeria arxii CBS 175.79 TaxID=1450172 RepID=A0A6A5XU28_9PLEO|nr:actin-like ATPase domain-containing protein [Aaosphaeria arxii CBS 175.79]KAF2016160.1 actin-like ATPase domain-containing protein [Aaosphaeria arxii CBS 175.79]